MDYDAIATHFLTPAVTPSAAPVVPDTPARALRDAVEPVATIGWWSRGAADRMAALGHDFFDGYVWGRAAALGADVAPAVVVAAFGAFEPTMLTSVLQLGRSISTRDAILTARADGASAGLQAATSGIAPATVAAFADRLLPALASLDATGRPLFGALRDLGIPTGPYGRAWRASELVREHRGDGHIAARVAAGIDVVTMNVLTECWLGYRAGEYTSTRGYSSDRVDLAVAGLRRRGWMTELGELTVAGRQAREHIEAATDRSQDELVAALGMQLADIVRTATVLGAAILAARAAPADARKRAAG
jgi:hypothetical protein